jgi:GNAT superfamily N-acetyltransferase
MVRRSRSYCGRSWRPPVRRSPRSSTLGSDAEDDREWPRDEYVAEITFIEIRADLHGQGLGTEIVRELMRRYRGRAVAAHPKMSDGFWESIGWKRHDNVRDHGSAPPSYATPRGYAPCTA